MTDYGHARKKKIEGLSKEIEERIKQKFQNRKIQPLIQLSGWAQQHNRKDKRKNPGT